MGNPFQDVTLSARFRQGDRTLEAEGFYDGDGIGLLSLGFVLAATAVCWARSPSACIPTTRAGLNGGAGRSRS
jgi:hypothetical protein